MSRHSKPDITDISVSESSKAALFAKLLKQDAAERWGTVPLRIPVAGEVWTLREGHKHPVKILPGSDAESTRYEMSKYIFANCSMSTEMFVAVYEPLAEVLK